MSFNQKYNRQVAELPNYVLSKIRSKVLEKYKIDDSNEAIDAIFEQHLIAYRKKRDYDKTYFKNSKKGENQRVAQLQQENAEYKKYVQQFVNYQKAHNLPLKAPTIRH